MGESESSQTVLIICLGENLLEEEMELVLCDRILNNGIILLRSGV